MLSSVSTGPVPEPWAAAAAKHIRDRVLCPRIPSLRASVSPQCADRPSSLGRRPPSLRPLLQLASPPIIPALWSLPVSRLSARCAVCSEGSSPLPSIPGVERATDAQTTVMAGFAGRQGLHGKTMNPIWMGTGEEGLGRRRACPRSGRRRADGPLPHPCAGESRRNSPCFWRDSPRRRALEPDIETAGRLLESD